MCNINRFLALPCITIREAFNKLNNSACHILVIVDSLGKLLGTLTDGDIRRKLLDGYSIDDSIESIYNKNPKFCYECEGRDQALKLMELHNLDQIPILNSEGKVLGLELFKKKSGISKIETPVVFMAGGIGKRLRPLTLNIPKALSPIGDKPVLEHILNKFICQGFYKFYICVNYKAEMIKDYFSDGTKFGVEIEYIYEERPLGTAGALANLPFENVRLPFIVTNCDVLSDVDYKGLLDFHSKYNSDLTVCTRVMTYDVPYGVINSKDFKLISIDEKPSFNYEVNAGMYVLGREAFSCIPKNKFFNMTDLISVFLEKNKNLFVYEVPSYWIDIGKIEDLERARQDHENNVF
jgi:dTDP-glucose pyrophosphorylase